jgi:hypothetical protein
VLARRPKKPLPDLSIAKIPFVVLCDEPKAAAEGTRRH